MHSLRSRFEPLVGQLRSPLTAREAEQGWTEKKKEVWLQRVERLQEQLANGENPRPTSLARAMDFDGVGDSDLADLAAKVSLAIDRGDAY